MAAGTEEQLDKLKLAELKELLQNKGAPSSGKKGDLIQRVIEVYSEQELQTRFPQQLYTISESGKAFLAENEECIKLHQHINWGISWKEYSDRKKEGYGFFDVVWGLLNEQILESTDFGYDAYKKMYQLLVEEGKQAKAYDVLLHIVFLKLSGINTCRGAALYLESTGTSFITIESLLEEYSFGFFMGSDILSEMPKYSLFAKDEIINRLYEWKLPMQVCPKSLLIAAVDSMLKGEYNAEEYADKYKKAYRDAMKAVK